MLNVQSNVNHVSVHTVPIKSMLLNVYHGKFIYSIPTNTTIINKWGKYGIGYTKNYHGGYFLE